MAGKRTLEEMGSDNTQKTNGETAAAAEPMDVDDKPTTCSRGPRPGLLTLLSRPSPFANETGPLACGEFEPIDSPTSNNIVTTANYPPGSLLTDAKVLVVGAGGLGCELLKDLALSGIRHVDVIDLDTIDVTNLNRQFLFRQKDVGSSKAETAAKFIQERCPWMKVTAHHGKIQDKDASFYSQFDVILSGLDNVEARRWLNATICGLVQFDDDGDMYATTIIPMIDGGTEAFSGQARFILPRITSCFECTIDSFPPQTSFPLCTIAETPRRPEHCIAYASILLWPKHFDKKLDTDSPDDMKWVYERALERANQYNIPGVTYMMTMGVVKNIIPAVASTNAIVAAACVNEAVKYITFCSQNVNSYMMYMGSAGIYSHTFAYEKKEDCIVCSQTVRKVTCAKSMTLNEFIQEHLKDSSSLQLKSPSLISASGKTLYMQKPKALEQATRPNLDKPLSELLTCSGEEVTITDPLLESINLSMAIHFE